MLILIVDSNAKRRQGLCHMLSSRGHTLQSAANRTNAIRILRKSQQKPRVILLDPDCDGVSVEQFLSVVLEVSPVAKVLLLPTPVCV